MSTIDDLFSKSIDDLADLPGFETPPPGSYILNVTCEVKKVNEKDAVEASFTVVETSELANDSDTPVPAGTKFSTLFMLDNEFGVGNLKKFLKPFADHYDEKGIGALIEQLKDVTIACLVKNRKDKNDPDKVYGSVSNIVVA
jgi:hypothetical protein